MASSATLALNSGERFYRFFILDHFFHHVILLRDWSQSPRPPLWSDKGVFAQIMKGFVAKDPDKKTIAIDATYLKTHLTASRLAVKKDNMDT